MRKLVVLVVVLTVVAVGLAVGDAYARTQIEQAVAQRIETAVPGSSAKVQVSSSWLLARVALTGKVQRVSAQVTGVKVGAVPVDSVDLTVDGIDVSRPDLLQGKVVVRSVGQASATAEISQHSLDSGIGAPVTLGSGTVGVAGVQLPAHISVSGGRLHVSVPPLPAVSLPLPPSTLVPCPASAVITPGLLTLSCTTDTVPPALLQAAGGG